LHPLRPNQRKKFNIVLPLKKLLKDFLSPPCIKPMAIFCKTFKDIGQSTENTPASRSRLKKPPDLGLIPAVILLSIKKAHNSLDHEAP